MKNTECVIHITTKNGSRQTFRRKGKGWIQKSAAGKIYPMTAEQVLSHILPPLAGKSPAILKVKAKSKKPIKQGKK
jgi:hypothetical protein